MNYFDSHIHITSPSLEGINSLLKHMSDHNQMLGGLLILNTIKEVEIVSEYIDKIPNNLIIAPFYNVPKGYNKRIYESGWIKIHPKISALIHSDILKVLDFIEGKKDEIRGIIVDSFPWGTEIEYNISLPLTIELAKKFSDKSILVAHGGGYDSWKFLAHLGGLKNVYFDFSVSMKYYADTELIKPLRNYLKHSPKKILFGTDWPFGEVNQHIFEYDKLGKEAGISAEKLELMLLNNSSELWDFKKKL
jgi:hypothetical protein